LKRDPEPGLDGGGWMPSALLFGLALGVGGYAVWRRSAGAQARAAARRGESAVTRLSSHPLTPHASVHTVQWNGEEFLLACTPQQVTVLARRASTGAQGEAP
jgi:flagellar biogenesis protein FliO